jgi:CO/xanthine dehydrogenase Mo-binding subunit
MIHKGRGIATIFYPSGFNAGGDPDLVSLRIRPDGTVDVSNASCEMGQGIKNVVMQIVAERLELDINRMNFDNYTTDTAAFSMDTAGTRSTVIVGNAAIRAADDLIKKMKDLKCEALALEYEAGRVFVKSDPEKGMTIQEIGGGSTFGGVNLMGLGGYRPDFTPRDPSTGATIPSKVLAYGSSVIDVEVDDETGVVRIENIYNCYDMGTVINPLQAEAQVDGGNVQGIAWALLEDLAPNFPHSIEPYASNFTDYLVPTFMDTPKHSALSFYQNYDPTGPYGAKGCGEMVVDTQMPAIVNAIYNAVGIVVDSLPATPEKILRLLEEKSEESK